MNYESEDSQFTDLDTQVEDEPIVLSAYDRYVIARARLLEAVHVLSVASIQANLDPDSYSKALDKVACASAHETEAFKELQHFF